MLESTQIHREMGKNKWFFLNVTHLHLNKKQL